MNARSISALVGLLIIGVSVLAMTDAIYELMRIGTCASGGPYVSARACPPGTGAKILALIASIFGLLVGAGLTASWRGALAAWGLGFGALSAAFFVSAFGPAAPTDPDGATVGVALGVGGMFAVMALPALIGAVAKRSGDGEPGRARGPRIVMATGAGTTSMHDTSFGTSGNDFWNFTPSSGSDGSGWGGSSDAGGSGSDSGGSSDSGSSGCSSGCGGGCGGGGD